MLIGVMQGRLVPPAAGRFQSFPRDDWEREFELARAAGLDAIEWIYDEFGADANPLATDAGLERMRSLAAESGVRVLSLCADYFMDRPFPRATPQEVDERLATLAWLAERAARAGIRHLVLPFVDASRIETDEELSAVAAILRRGVASAERHGVELHLEASLPPARFAALLAQSPHPLIKVNYDSGNSASLGYRPAEEFSAYGSRIGSFHLKDRRLGGGTVPLGQGAADFPAVFAELAKIGYDGNIILQVAREVPGAEVAWVRRNVEFLKAQWPAK